MTSYLITMFHRAQSSVEQRTRKIPRILSRSCTSQTVCMRTRVTAMQIHKCDVSEGWIQLMQPFAKPVFALRPRTLACLRVRSQNANDFRPVLHGHSLPRVAPLDHATNRNRESANNAAVDNGLANALIRRQTDRVSE